MQPALATSLGLLALAACTPPLAPASAPAPPSAFALAPAPAPAPAPASAWSPITQSPWAIAPDAASEGDGNPIPDASPNPNTSPQARVSSLATACGAQDGALTHVARDLAAIRARGLAAPDAEAIIAKLRAAGEPYVRPRVIFASGHAPIDDTKIRNELAPTTSSNQAKGRVRCGVAIAQTPHGGEVLVAVRVEALADLAPLPTRARTGEWLSFEAKLHASARSAKLVVLGPRGAPRTVPTSLDPNGVARARFALDQPGAFTVQLIADLEAGPRPLLEAMVFADITPPPPGEESPAPGEDDPAATGNDAVALARMVGALRTLEGFPPLAHDEKLDALALAHAERMRDRHSVAHDLGDGDFKDRFEAEGTLDARAVGENVAHAPTVALAHRALHASPSHRINLLRADYTYMGTGVARAADGSVYVCETFAATPRSPSR